MWLRPSQWVFAQTGRDGLIGEPRMMREGTFRIEELNPFQEWHHHGSSSTLEDACRMAQKIAQMIGRKTRVLDEDGRVMEQVNPSFPRRDL